MDNDNKPSNQTTNHIPNKAHPVTSGSYTANLLGNIQSHLAGLQGFDVMALELIQNADDAQAEQIIFNITETGLVVFNSGTFTYCGDMSEKPCRLIKEQGYTCDFHRIADVGSGGKLSNNENIGRFGIGFVSTYQITDHPEIHSSGNKLTLHPETGQWTSESIDHFTGTTFILPWADNPNSTTRKAISASNIRQADIEQLIRDLRTTLQHSLLFLRHIKKAEVHKNGNILLGCELDRIADHELTLNFYPDEKIERWHILRGDAGEAGLALANDYDILNALDRDTRFSIALRLEPESLKEGWLYAFLPTEQHTGLPLHINADFFPESDRKTIVFAKTGHMSPWNEMLIEQAALKLSNDPAYLIDIIGVNQYWRMLQNAYEIAHQDSNYPSCFKSFWKNLKKTAPEFRTSLDQYEHLDFPESLFLPQNRSFTDRQSVALKRLGVNLVSETLYPYRNALHQVGSPFLNLKDLVKILEAKIPSFLSDSEKTTSEDLQIFWLPLWDLLENLLPDTLSTASNSPGNKLLKQLKGIKILVTENLDAVSVAQAYKCPKDLDPQRVSKLLPSLHIASHHINNHPKIAALTETLTLDRIAQHLKSRITENDVHDIISTAKNDLSELYYLFAEIDKLHPSRAESYKTLRDLPLWQSSQGLISASSALLPGNFSDPTGLSDLLDVSLISGITKDFLSNKLDIKTQTIETFVETVFPKIFSDEGPFDESIYPSLISELSSHPSLLDNVDVKKLFKNTPLIPTQAGRWALPGNTYHWSDELETLLGNNKDLWLDHSKLPPGSSVRAFIESLGIRRNPAPEHLAERMVSVANHHSPDDDSKKASANAFYALCDLYEGSNNFSEFTNASNTLKREACFPVKNDARYWHRPDELHAPYQAEAFESQAHILDFRNTQRLKTSFLSDLGIKTSPETELVINHLKYCIEHNTAPATTTYQILNQRSKSNTELIEGLKEARCIYIGEQQGFVRSNQIYWQSQNLGKYAFTVPPHLKYLSDFFDAIGVKDDPDSDDLTDIILDIIEQHYVRSIPVTGSENAVYENCMNKLSEKLQYGSLSDDSLRRLKESPSVLNLHQNLNYPDEVLFNDSEWLVGFFEGELNHALCKPSPDILDLVELLGVQRLSRACSVDLNFVDGKCAIESEITNELTSRVDILRRLLHEKSSSVHNHIRDVFSQLMTESYDTINIHATAEIGGSKVDSQPCDSAAFYDIANGRLMVSRPIDERIWPRLLTSLFHQIMPDETGGEISNLTMNFHSTLGKAIQEAHEYLSNFGIPELSAEADSDYYNLSSQEVNGIGTATDSEAASSSDEPIEAQPSPTSRDASSSTEAAPSPSNRQASSAAGPESGENTSDTSKNESQGRGTKSTPHSSKPSDAISAPSSDEKSDSGEGNSVSGASRRKSRSQHKQQWDRRLISYVTRASESSSKDEDDELTRDQREHNLAIETVTREAVVRHEQERGRLPEQMPQTHPGYDVVSVDPQTGEDRYIEIKGVSGEWNQTGVGLSKLQFSNAQDYGESYWLYVVEFASDPENIRIHPIRNPASQVTAFMFDGNWRDAVTDEAPDPTAMYIAGSRVEHKTMGRGEIREVKTRGKTKLLTIQFDDKSAPTPNITLNIHQIVLLDTQDGDNNT